MGLSDIFNASSIKKENEKLNNLFDELGAGDAIKLKEKMLEYEKAINEATTKLESIKNENSLLEEQLKQKQSAIIVLDEELLLESFALYKAKFNFATSEEYKSRLENIRNEQKFLIKTGDAVYANENWTVNGSKSEGKKMVNDMKKLMVRSFNNECDYCVDNVKFNNMEVNEKRIEKSFETLNKLGRIMSARISEQYKKLKYDELYLAFEYQQKKQDEKEEQKRVREELREQQKLEQEIKQAREKIAKERRHFSAALKDLEKKLLDAANDEMRLEIRNKLEEVKNNLLELEQEEKVIDYREKNAKAGYVYIISNIGAFGENVYKIGMTRRLEPMDRVDELGDASVPFTFDVHALIFSDNAPMLENKLHEHFYKNRINKLNNRKEFFRADINEIEKVVKENYDKVVDIMKEAPAEQYRESLLIN